MTQLDVIGLGLAAMDIVIVVDSLPTWDAPGRAHDLQIAGGGPAATACVAAARLGTTVGFVGTFGNDEFGHKKRDGLDEAGVDVSHMIERNEPEQQLIIVYVQRSTGERLFMPVIRNAADRSPDGKRSTLGPDGIDRDYITSASILHIDGCHPEAALAAARWIHEAGGSVMLDGSATRGSVSETMRELVAETDYLVCGTGFTTVLTGEPDCEAAVRAALSLGPQVVVETAGDEGSHTATREEVFFTPAYRVDVVDTTGAGDVFHGAFLTGLVNRWPIGIVSRFATAAAAISCTRLGGRAGCPSFGEVQGFLADRQVSLPE